MKNRKEDKFNYVMKTIDIIQRGVKNKWSKEFIEKQIKKEIPYQYKYFNTIFNDIMGQSISQYIKDAIFLRAFNVWEKEKKSLSQRAYYEGIKYFSYYFKRRFNCSIEEIDVSKLEEKEKPTFDELVLMKEYLDKSTLIDKYEMKRGDVCIQINEERFLQLILSKKSYIIAKKILIESNWDELPKESKKMLLIFLDKAVKTSKQETITVSEEELAKGFEEMDMYDLESPEELNGYCIFSCHLDNKLKDTFKKLLSLGNNSISINFPNGDSTPLKYIELVNSVKECYGHITLSRLSEKTNKSQEDIVDILWEMAQKGFLKFVA